MTSKFGSDLFIDRHLGLGDNDERIMLNKLGFNNIDQFINQVIPEDIQLKDKSSEILPQGCSEIEALNELEEIANKNTKMRSLIGLGYYDNHMPKVIQRSISLKPSLFSIILSSLSPNPRCLSIKKSDPNLDIILKYFSLK